MNYMNVYKNWRLEKKALRDYGYFYKKMEAVLKEILHYYTTEKKYNVAISIWLFLDPQLIIHHLT